MAQERYILRSDYKEALDHINKLAFVRMSDGSLSVRPRGFSVEIARIRISGNCCNAESDLEKLANMLTTISYTNVERQHKFLATCERNAENARRKRAQRKAQRLLKGK